MLNLLPVLKSRLPGVMFTTCRQVSNYHRETYYDILRVKSNCSDKEIRQAFVDMSKRFHPDVSGKKADPYFTSRFVKISEAYHTLSKPKLRTAYDHDLRARGIRIPCPDVPPRAPEVHKPYEIVVNKTPNPGPYYGIDGLEKLPNSKIAFALLLLGIFGAILGFSSVKYNFDVNSEKLNEKSAIADAHHNAARAEAEKFGNEEILRRMLNKVKADR